MKIRIVTASAGSGKTYRLTSILDEEIGAGRVKPERLIAVTFTRQAAAELVERARGKLLASKRGLDAHRLLAARIGTVNAVCGALVTDFAFELGLSPALRVLDEDAAELEFSRAVGRVVTSERADQLERFKHVFTDDLDWRADVRRVVEAARSNHLGAAALLACAQRSTADLEAILGPVTHADLDRALDDALATAITALERIDDGIEKTTGYIALCKQARRGLERGTLRWGEWAKLEKAEPSKKLLEHSDPVAGIAAQHVAHPRLRADLHGLIDQVFDVAARSLAAYAEHKRTLGVIDFVDQEALALTLLRRPDVRAALAGQLDLFLVDEFQDTSPIQLAVFLELAALAKQSIWVGDPKQAIYGFRGTDPVLMDAAIESLTVGEGDLVEAATTAVAKGTVETLSVSYRSRPGLVQLTSEIFARAFAHHGMPAERTRLQPELATDPEGLGDLVQVWPLIATNAEGRAAATAAGIRDLLERQAPVRDREDRARPARRKDVAVLCRTNAQCRELAAALGALGIAAVLPRFGLLDTHEAMVVLAGLGLWADSRDAVAAGELARLITYPDDLDGFVARALATPGDQAFAQDPTVQRVLTARAAERDLGPIAALDAVLGATEVRRLCAEWGATGQRLANLDALRAHAVAYDRRASAAGEAATIVGLLGYLDELASPSTWREQRSDSQARLANEDAVTISTWHAAKGLEWPITVMFGLESIRAASSWGVHVLSDRAELVVADPLGGRWIRFWPFPYTTTNQHGRVRTVVEASAGHRALAMRAARETLRVLYVGWTRARDRLVLAAAPGKLLKGILGTLTAIDPTLIDEPRAGERTTMPVRWAGVKVDVVVAPVAPAEPAAPTRSPGEITCGNPRVARPPARTVPSGAERVPATVGEVIDLGARLQIRGSSDMEPVGHAVHAFLAADRPGLTTGERVELATRLLAGFGVTGSLEPLEVVEAGTRLWATCASRFPGARLHREWPVAYRTPEGTVIAGTADLVLSTDGGMILVDHKTFPGSAAEANARALTHAGQLHAYATCVAVATSKPVASSWIHFPVLGKLIEVRVNAAPGTSA